MRTLAERLTEAMKGPPEIKPAELARACRIKQPSVSGWLSGKTKKLEGANLLAAAECLRVNYWWLADGSGEMRPTGKQQERPVAVAEWPFPRIPEDQVRALDESDRNRLEGAIALAIAQLKLKIDLPDFKIDRATTPVAAALLDFDPDDLTTTAKSSEKAKQQREKAQ